MRHPGARVEADGPRACRGRALGRLRPDRDDCSGVRDAFELAGRRPERDLGILRPAGWRDVHKGRCRSAKLASASRGRAGASSRRAGAAACAGCPRCLASCPCPRLAEEIDTPGEGQVRALVTVAGNPLVSTPNAVAPRASRRGARFHGRGRHLLERDDAPRRRRAPLARSARALSLRPGALPVRRAQRGQLLAGCARSRRGLDRGVRDLPAADGHRHRPGCGLRRRGDRRRCRAARSSPARSARPAVSSRAATPARSWPSSSPGAAPTACSTS